MPPTRLVAVLTSDPDGPVVRHRWRAFLPALGRAGVFLEIVPWTKDPEARRRALRRAEVADGVVVSSRLLRRRDTRALRRRARRLAFDLDDALPFRDSARGARSSWTRRRRFRALVRASDRVFVGNEYLAGLIRRREDVVEILPTVVEVPDAPPPGPPPADPAVVGWIGSRATLPYLEALWLPLSAVVTAGVALRLRVIADVPPSMPPGVAVEHVPWTLAGWRQALSTIHIGLAPLPDDAWTRGKCGLKVLQMMSVGRPVVASAVGVQERQVRHGVTGYLTREPADVVDALQQLLDDPDLRVRMGRAGWARAREAWSVRVWAPRVVEAVERWLA